jgi:hypothetical protein
MRFRLFPILVIFAGCGLLGPSPGGDLEKQRAAWDALGRESYAFVYRRSCFCPPPSNDEVRVFVDANEVVSVTSVETGEPPVDANDLSSWPTIDSLFDYVGHALDEGADDLTVDYHEEFFFPTLISIDWIEEAVDDEISHSASGLVPVLR